MYLFALVTSSDPALDLNSFVGLGVNVATYILGIVGALTLLMFVYGGFTWILSGGSADKVKKGKDIILGSVVGLMIVFSSYLIIDYVVNNVFQATKETKEGTKPAFDGTAPKSTPPNDPNKCTGACVSPLQCTNLNWTAVGKKDCTRVQTDICCVPPPTPE